MKNVLQRVLLIGCCLALWVGALGVRRAVLSQQTRSLQGKEAPFLKESALQFRMTRMVYETGTLPDTDASVGVPNGVEPRKTYSLGAEWIYSALARVFPEDMTLTSKIRWASAGLFSLAVPFAFLWVWLATGSVWGGILTGSILAVSPAFAVRSSGLELSRENLAIPLFVLFFVGEMRVRHAQNRLQSWWFAGVSAAVLALAQCFWDLTQYITGCWAVYTWARSIRAGSASTGERKLWGSVTAAMVLAAVLNPYLRFHGFLFSPVVGILLARCLIMMLPLRGRWGSLLCGVGLVGIWMLLGRWFVENYSHFGELLSAKLVHGNVKPEDPGVLSYLQRIMWTPALNSSNRVLTAAYFPFILYVGIPASLVCFFGKDSGENSGSTDGNSAKRAVGFYALFTLPVYILFFRFHVFLSLFLAVCLGMAVARVAKSTHFWIRHLIPFALLLLISGVELYHLLFFEPAQAGKQSSQQVLIRQMVRDLGISAPNMELPDNRWGSAHKLHYLYVEDLLRKLNEDLPEADPLANPERQEPLLANFGISGTVLTYTGMPIVLHPKFETPGIREKVREFYEHLYVKSEREFRDWAVANQARYYLHRKNSFAGKDLRNSAPYMVDALDPPAGASWRILEHHPEQAEWFVPIPISHPLYRLYRVITPEDVEMARSFTRMARQRYEMGDLDQAREWAVMALTYHWKFLPAREVLARVRNAGPNTP